MVFFMWVTLIAVLYASFSFIFLRQPMLIYCSSRHKRKLAFACKHISHRGGAGEHLENTITAYDHAMKLGTDMIELDCQLTRDNQVVVSHDDELARISGVEAKISDTLYQDLPEMKQTLPLDFDPSILYTDDSGDRRIPLLSEVFERFPDTVINIDVKTTSIRLMHEIEKLVVKYNRQHITVWGNYRDSICMRCHDLNPSIPLLFSMKGVLRLLLLFYSGLLPFVELKESVLEIPMCTVFLSAYNDDELSANQRMVLKAADKLLMRKALFLHLRKRGIPVYVWVLNREADFERAFALGASGVMTDFPGKLKDFLDKHPEFPLHVE